MKIASILLALVGTITTMKIEINTDNVGQVAKTWVGTAQGVTSEVKKFIGSTMKDS